MPGKDFFRKEATERDALNRILWDKKLNRGDFEVFYVDRFSPELKKINFSEAEVVGDFLVHKESLIPLHRIRKIAYKGSVVWEKRRA